MYVFEDFYMEDCTGTKPYPDSVPWTGVKRIYTVINLDKK